MALPESDQRDFVCVDRECGPSQLSSDPARVPAASKDPWGNPSPVSRSTRTRAPGGERLTARAAGPTAVIVRRLSKNRQSRQGRPQTQARMGSS